MTYSYLLAVAYCYAYCGFHFIYIYIYMNIKWKQQYALQYTCIYDFAYALADSNFVLYGM